MIAQLVISKNEKQTKEYLNLFIKTYKIKKVNIFSFRPEKNIYSIEKIREVVNYLNLPNKTKRLFVFYCFDKATIEAQNTFLKTLEEGQKINVSFILFASNQFAFLETIKSRCQLIILKKTHYKGISSQTASLITSLYNDKTLSFLARQELINLKRENFDQLLKEILIELRKRLSKEPVISAAIIDKGMTAAEEVKRDNINPRLVFDNFLIFAYQKINHSFP